MPEKSIELNTPASSAQLSNKRRYLIIFAIVFAGEVIFSLPFHIARFFRPTLLQVLDITNTELGDIFALYGVMAMLAYFPGGVLADRLSGRTLMSFSLLATALGGIYFACLPSVLGLKLLFSYWGVTTIFLFWASMLKVTREIGGESAQGKAFGILDGGRGLVAAALATIAVYLLSQFFPDVNLALSKEQREQAFLTVIYFYSVLTLIAALVIWWVLPTNNRSNHQPEHGRLSAKQITGTLTQSSIWYQAIIVLTAYCCYKGLDFYGLYSTTALGFNELKSSQLMAYAAFLRPISALAAGILADRYSGGKIVVFSFLGAATTYLIFAISGSDMLSHLFMVNVLVSFVFVFAIRAVYFALLAESNVDAHVTGTSIGFISLVGFTPDIFFAPITGRILDATPGLEGFQHLFTLLVVIALIGAVAALALIFNLRNKKQNT